MPDTETTVEALIIGKIEDLKTSVTQRMDSYEATTGRRFDDQNREFGRRLDRQDRTLEDIQEQTRKTNGRVTTLEKARERAQGALFAYAWVPAALTAVLTAGLTILIMALSGGLTGA